MKEDKLAKKESTELATVPDYLKDENENLGGELANPSEDMLVPRIKLVQGLTEEHTSLKIPEGHWVNSITKEDYGEEIMFNPLLMVPGHLMFEGVGREAKLIARKFAGDIIPPLEEHLINDETKSWGKDGTKPKAQKCFCYIGMVNGEAVTITLSSTAIKVAKNLNTLLHRPAKDGKRKPYFAYYVKLGSVQETSDKGVFYLPTAELAGFVPPDVYSFMRLEYEKISLKKFDTNFNNETSEATGKKEEKDF